MSARHFSNFNAAQTAQLPFFGGGRRGSTSGSGQARPHPSWRERRARDLPMGERGRTDLWGAERRGEGGGRAGGRQRHGVQAAGGGTGARTTPTGQDRVEELPLGRRPLHLVALRHEVLKLGGALGLSVLHATGYRLRIWGSELGFRILKEVSVGEVLQSTSCRCWVQDIWFPRYIPYRLGAVARQCSPYSDTRPWIRSPWHATGR